MLPVSPIGGADFVLNFQQRCGTYHKHVDFLPSEEFFANLGDDHITKLRTIRYLPWIHPDADPHPDPDLIQSAMSI